MEGSSKIKYAPNKTQLTLAEYKNLITEYKRENRKLKAEFVKAQKDREWAMDKLQEAQLENRRLGITITLLSEKGGSDAESNSR